MSLEGKFFKLANGVRIPALAFGVGTRWFKLGDNEVNSQLVGTLQMALAALKADGFVPLLDGAEAYNTDREIGHAIAGRPREDFFLSDKWFSGDESYTYRSTHANPYEALKHALKNELKTDYVDVYLMHSPFVKKEVHGFDVVEAWTYMERLVDEGYARSLGVSNFSTEDLQKLLDSKPRIKPVLHQIEYSPYLQNQSPGIVQFSQKHGLLVQGYLVLTPLTSGRGGPLDSVVLRLAGKYGKTEDQVLLRWALQTGILPVSTTGTERRIRGLLDVFKFELTQAEVEEISSLGRAKTVRKWWTDAYAKNDQ